MKRILYCVLSLFVASVGFFALTACNTTTTASTTATAASTTSTTTSSTTTSVAQTAYYLAGSFNGYAVADTAYQMTAIAGEPGWYTFTVVLTAENRDPLYNDGHYYKVTEGNWTHCYGAAEYDLQPAPVSPSNAGLGSVWVENDQTLTVLFDSSTHKVYDSSMVRTFENPVLYGDFASEMGGTDWSYVPGSGGLALTDADEDGIYTGEFAFPAYEGTGEGWSIALVLSEQYYIGTGYHVWGAGEQYKLDGTVAGMGGVSYLAPETPTTYTFSYDSETHVTTVVEQVVALASPTIYGDFNTWSLTENAVVLVQNNEVPTEYLGSVTLAAGTYSFAVVLDKVNYGIWGFGAGTQYLFSGEAGGMGKMTYIELTAETTLHFVYDSVTHKTVVDHDAYELLTPTIYGTFTRKTDDAECFLLKGEGAGTMTPVSGSSTQFEIDLVLPLFAAPTSGWYTADTGYRMLVVTTYHYYSAWNVWGAGVQYDLSGAVTGTPSIVTITEAGTYHFVFDTETHITSYTKID